MNDSKTKKTGNIDGISLAHALKTMVRNMESGRTIYLAFSRMGFYVLVFVMGMSIIANVVLLDLLISAPATIVRTDNLVFIAQLSLSIAAVIAGLWLFLKGVNIIVDK